MSHRITIPYPRPHVRKARNGGWFWLCDDCCTMSLVNPDKARVNVDYWWHRSQMHPTMGTGLYPE